MERICSSVEFVVVDDELFFLNKVCAYIDKYMMSNEVDYKIYSFTKVTNELYNIIRNNNKKIYVLDIQIGNDSGIDLSRKIRDTDYDSIIIFLTAFDYKDEVAGDDIMFLTYIDKYNNFEKHFIAAINKAMKILNQNKLLQFTSKGTSYKLPLNDIIYIEKIKNSKYCLIHTNYINAKIYQPIKDIYNQLTSNFNLFGRSLIINTTYIRTIDKKENKIILSNGQDLNIPSYSEKK